MIKKLLPIILCIVMLYSCKKDIGNMHTSYTQEEFEDACHSMLYSTQQEYLANGLTPDHSDFNEFMSRDDLPEDINIKIQTYLYQDYISYHS